LLKVRYARYSFFDFQGQFTGIQRCTIGPGERAQMYEEGLSSWVSEIKKLGELTVRSMCKHIIPPWIVPRRRHVIRHDVEQYFKTERASARNEAGPRYFTAKIVADSSGVRYVISMLAAGHCLKTGRQVHMADSQVGQVRQNPLRRA
jgi:hypothetical protein